MTTRRVAVASTGLLLALIVGSAVALWAMHQRFVQIAELDAQWSQAFSLGHEFRNSSLTLTRLVREYVTTGDPRYEDAFHAILAERSGDAPRPLLRDIAPGQRINLPTLMRRYNLTDSEQALFNRALALSNSLALLEIEAINAFNGRFPDASGHYNLKRPPNPDYARSLVFSEAYQRQAREILAVIDSFFFQALRRVGGAKTTGAQEILCLSGVIAFLLLLSVGIVLALAWHSIYRVALPLSVTRDAVDGMARGDLAHSLAVSGDDEIQQIRSSLNQMADNFRRCQENTLENASKDVLTGLWNRQKFFELLKDELARASRYGHTLALVQADIDNFRRLNWVWGQRAGDGVLRGFARMLTEQLRITDVLCRQGDDTFLLLLPEIAPSSTLLVMKKIRVLTEQLTVCKETMAGRITVSLGACLFGSKVPYDDALEALHRQNPDRVIRELFTRAETALLQSKARGGNAATLWTPPDAAQNAVEDVANPSEKA